MATYIECKVKYDKIQDNGAVKKVTDSYLVDAMTFTEAEARIVEETTPYISGEYSVSAVKKSNICEIFFDPGQSGRFFKVKATFISLDEKTGAEKRNASHFLVEACDFQDALAYFLKGMEGTVSDYEIASITETPILEVYKSKSNG